PCGLPPTAFSPCYGLAEATLVVSMKSPGETWRSIRVERPSPPTLGRGARVRPGEGPPPSDQVDVVALGPVVDGLDLAIVDERGAVVHEPLVWGGVGLGGPFLCARYVGGGGLRPGDIGFFEGGELYVVERMKNIVIRNGQNYSVHVFEQTLARQA